MNPTVSRGQQSRAAKARITLPDSPVPITRRSGPKTNPHWREDFLAAYQTHGGLYAAAETAGVDSTTVYDEFHRDPRFKTLAEEARQRFADSREQNLTRLANEGNVVGDIVLLKRHRPDLYIEKAISISASFTTQLDPAAGQALLATMLGQLAPTPTQPALEPPQP